MRPVELFGLDFPRTVPGSGETLLQRDEVRPLGLEHRAVFTKVELVDDVVLDPAFDGLAIGQEAATDSVRDLAEAQVEAGGLDVLVRDREAAGVDDARRDRTLQVLARQHARSPSGKVQVGRHGRAC